MRKSHYSSRPRTAERRAPPRKKTAVVFGKAYDLDDLQQLLADLQKQELETTFRAVVSYVSDNARISEGAANVPDIKKSDIDSIVAEALLRDGQRMLQLLKSRSRMAELAFLSTSSSMPPAVTKAARAALAEAADRPAPASAPKAYGSRELGLLLQKLDSEATKVRAVAEFLKNHHAVVEAAAREPMLTVTEVNTRVAKALEHRGSEVVAFLRNHKMVRSLGLLSSLPFVPEKVRREAAAALQSLAPPRPIPAPPATEGKTSARPPSAATAQSPQTQQRAVPLAPPRARTAPSVAPAKFSEAELKSLFQRMESPDARKAAAAVVEALKKYDTIAEFLTASPAATVTSFTSRVFESFSRNMDAVMGVMRERRETGVLEFLSKSSKTPEPIRKRAGELLKSLGGGK